MLLGAFLSGIIDDSYLKNLKTDVFYDENVKFVFEGISLLLERSNIVDYISIIDYLSHFKPSNEIRALIDTYIEKVPPEFNPNTCIEKIEESYIRRGSAKIHDSVKTLINVNPELAPELFLKAYEESKLLLQKKITYDVTRSFDQCIDEVLEGKTNSVFIKTGINAIDNNMGGLSLGEVSVIGGRPGHGKTTVGGVSLAVSTLNKNPNEVVILFSLEMSKVQIERKILSNLSLVSSLRIRLHTSEKEYLTVEDKERIKNARTTIENYKGRLFIFDDIYDLSSMCRIARQVNAKLIIVDYIGIMDGVSDDKRNQIGDIVKRAKRFSKLNSTHFCFLSQLNRTVEARDTKRPESSDLAESDQLTHTCSEIFLLLYQFKYTNDPADRYRINFITDKARHAVVNDETVYIDFDRNIISDDTNEVAKLKKLLITKK